MSNNLPCEDCCESPCVCDPRWKWMNDRVRDGCGVVTFGLTEDGDIGVWVAGDSTSGEGLCLGSGNTAADAIDFAMSHDAQSAAVPPCRRRDDQ